MAIPCQGFTFTWGDQTLREVQQLEVDFKRELPTSRTTRWTSSQGQVNLIGFSAINLPESDYGVKKRLTIQCPVNTAVNASGVLTALDRDCIHTNMTVRAIANDSVQFAYSFMLTDTLDNALIE